MHQRRNKRILELDDEIIGVCLICNGVCYSNEATACQQAGLDGLYCCDHIGVAVNAARAQANHEVIDIYVGFDGAVMDRDSARMKGLRNGARFYTQGLIGCVGVAIRFRSVVLIAHLYGTFHTLASPDLPNVSVGETPLGLEYVPVKSENPTSMTHPLTFLKVLLDKFISHANHLMRSSTSHNLCHCTIVAQGNIYESSANDGGGHLRIFRIKLFEYLSQNLRNVSHVNFKCVRGTGVGFRYVNRGSHLWELYVDE